MTEKEPQQTRSYKIRDGIGKLIINNAGAQEVHSHLVSDEVKSYFEDYGKMVCRSDVINNLPYCYESFKETMLYKNDAIVTAIQSIGKENSELENKLHLLINGLGLLTYHELEVNDFLTKAKE